MGRRVPKGGREAEDPGGCSVVAFLFLGRPFEIKADQSLALPEPVLAYDDGKLRASFLPTGGRFTALEYIQRASSRYPTVRQNHDALAGAIQFAGCSLASCDRHAGQEKS